MDDILTKKYCLTVVKAEGCGACEKYQEKHEAKVKTYVESRGDLNYQDLECASTGAGITKIITGVDSRGKPTTENMTKILGYPFQGQYYYPTFVIYESNPAHAEGPVPVIAYKKIRGYDFATIQQWIVTIMGEPKLAAHPVDARKMVAHNAPAPIPAPVEEDDDLRTISLTVTKSAIIKTKKSTKTSEIKRELVPDDEIYCDNEGYCLPQGYERVAGKGTTGNPRARRVKATAASSSSQAN